MPVKRIILRLKKYHSLDPSVKTLTNDLKSSDWQHKGTPHSLKDVTNQLKCSTHPLKGTTRQLKACSISLQALSSELRVHFRSFFRSPRDSDGTLERFNGQTLLPIFRRPTREPYGIIRTLRRRLLETPFQRGYLYVQRIIRARPQYH